MPHFCSKHDVDTYLCQICAEVHCHVCDGKDSVWMNIPGTNLNGNVCPTCLKKHQEKVLVTHIYGSIDVASEKPKEIKVPTWMSNASQIAFERFKVWLKERELPEDTINKFMYMGKTDRDYQFKNINTRNYLNINIVPKMFNL